MLELKGLSKSFGGVQAVRDVSMRLAAGQAWSVEAADELPGRRDLFFVEEELGAELDGPLAGSRDVGHGDVGDPVRRRTGIRRHGQHAALHAVAPAEDPVRAHLRHLALLRLPAEDAGVELLVGRRIAGEQLVPAEETHGRGHGMLGLGRVVAPEGHDQGAARILQHGEAAHVGDVRARKQHLAAQRSGRSGQCSIGDRQTNCRQP